MQDNFSYNKIQGGSSLFMKSDSDGVFDASNAKADLVIKSSPEGIKYFTDWDALSTSIEERNFAKFEDSQPTQINYSDFDSLGGLKKSFKDEWSANDIKILDDIAFVSYKDYTDIERAEFNIDGKLIQFAKVDKLYTTSSDMVFTTIERVGGLTFLSNIASDIPFGESDFCSTILKLELKGTFNDGVGNIDPETLSMLPTTMYFLYGGKIIGGEDNLLPIFNINYNDVNYFGSEPRSIISNTSSSEFSYIPNLDNPLLNDQTAQSYSVLKNKLLKLENVVVGRFYLHALNEDSTSFSIKLSIQSNYGLDENFRSIGYVKDGNVTKDATFDDVFIYSYSPRYVYHSIDFSSCTLIKLQPVRKCGKVDIYTKKKGIVSSISENNIHSVGHDLSTNDIIEIHSVLYDETSIENFTVSQHPTNGKKFVKVIDEDNFEIYEDQFFKERTDTSKIRTVDGITWDCIGNAFGSIAQSWNYYGTLFSPTGRNGYLNSSYKRKKSPLDFFFTNKRFLKIDDSPNDDIDINRGALNLDFDLLPSQTTNTLFAKNIDAAIPLKLTSLNTEHKSIARLYTDFYPYNCKDSESDTSEFKALYKGCGFGTSLDFKFSHASGNSKVYTLAIGEPGSDVSVDIFGLLREGEDFPRYFISDDYTNIIKEPSLRSRSIPTYLPHGKVHLFSITVDTYNNITNLSHENTIFGGGYDLFISTLDTNYIENREINPWDNVTATNIPDSPSRFLAPQIERNHLGFLFQENIAFSRYWIRSAVAAWRPSSIRSFRDNLEPLDPGPYYRDMSNIDSRYFENSIRAVSYTDPNVNVSDIYSRFGFAGYGVNVPKYEKIDRFGQLFPYEPRSKFLFPWVDSFGKSVAIKNDSSLIDAPFDNFSSGAPKSIIVVGSTTRSNIEINNELNQPVLESSQYLTESDCRSEIGQLSAYYLYKDDSDDYRLVDYMEINAGGSNSGRFSANLLTATKNGIVYTYLPPGYDAGLGLAEVTISCALSANQIEFIGDKLIWTDQRLRDNVSTVNILKYDDSAAQTFSPFRTISRPFNFPRSAPNPTTLTTTAYNTGDGFGFKFKINDKLFLTNCTDTKTDLGISISEYTDLDRLDTLQLYEIFNNKYEFTQKISPSIYTDNERYPLKLRFSFADSLIDLPNVNYDNNSSNTYTWNIDLTGRYDIVNNKILVKDPLEYSLFSRDYNEQASKNEGDIDTENAEIYMAMYEKTRLTPSIYNTNSNGVSTEDPVDEDNEAGLNGSFLTYEYIPESAETFLCEDYGGDLSEQRISKTPLLFFDLPLEDFDHLESITINYQLDLSKNKAVFEKINSAGQYIELGNLVPKVVAYRKDPRTTVMRNGPSTRGDINTFPKAKNGLWTELPAVVDPGQEELFSYQFPGWYRGGAQDLFFYSQLAGGHVDASSVSWFNGKNSTYLYGGEKNLGQYYDLTSGTRGGISPDLFAGDPAWVSPDIYHELTDTEKQSLLPYAKLFTPVSSVPVGGTINFSITLLRNQIKDFIIKGSAVNNIGRPTSNNNFIGNETFDDSDNTFGIIKEDKIKHTLILGLVQTNITSFDVNTGNINFVDIPTINSGPLKYIGVADSNNLQEEYLDARYPYCHHQLIYEDSFEGKKFTGESLNYSIISEVSNITVSVSKRSGYKRRYLNKFHKFAAFEYDKEVRNDIRINYSSSFTSTEKTTYEAFGFDRFVPVVSSIDKNPIISIGKTTEQNSDKLQILSTETVEDIDSSYFLDPESGDIEYNVPPTGKEIGAAFFNKYALLGSFDIANEKYLPLFINVAPSEDNAARLYTEGSIKVDKTADLFINPKSVSENGITLFTGQKTKDNLIPLFLKNEQRFNFTSLFIEEIQPSSIASLFTRSIDHESGIPLIMNPQTSGAPPLYIKAPLLSTNGISLVYTEYDTQESPLFIDGVFGINSGIPAYIDGVFGDTAGTTLAFSPGFSGVTPLTIGARFSSGNAPLFTIPHDNTNSNISLYTRTPEESGVSLYMINKSYNDSNDLFVNGLDSFTSSNELFVEGFIGSGYTARTPLFIGQEIDSDNFMPVFIKSIAGGEGSEAGSLIYGDEAPFLISGGLNYNSKNNTSLFLKVPGTGYVNDNVPLFLKVVEPVFGDGGGILSSGNLGLYLDGNNDAGIYYKINKSIPLYIHSIPQQSGLAPLYMKRPETNIMPLHINSSYSSGDINVYISGNYIYNDNIGLFIKPPESNDFRFFLRGYLE